MDSDQGDPTQVYLQTRPQGIFSGPTNNQHHTSSFSKHSTRHSAHHEDLRLRRPRRHRSHQLVLSTNEVLEIARETEANAARKKRRQQRRSISYAVKTYNIT
jgi:serine/threonine protein kinase HipA of HipAB toxin-antitoxin module